jgi:hypothetical protein
MQKQQQNARIAAAKAKQHIYISGIEGRQLLELGVAYHYRGHYIYAIPALNPIEPVPFSTKGGINIVGTVPHLTPPYDPHAPDLVPEPSVAALNKSCRNVWGAQEEQKEKDKEEVKQALEAEQAVEDEDDAAVVEMPVTVRSGSRAVCEVPQISYSTTLVPAQVLSRGSSRAGSRLASREDSHVSLPSLRVLDASRNTGDAAPSRSIRYLQASSTSDLASMVAADVASGLLSVPGKVSRAATPTLDCSSSNEAWAYGLESSPSRPTSAFAAKLHRLSSQPGSSASLADLAARDTHINHGGVSLATIPGLRHSSFNLDSYGSSPSLTALGREHPQPSTAMAPGIPTISAYAPPTLWDEAIYTPHDCARFLSDSAPGSRLASVSNTPQPSRPVSPTRSSSLRAASSTSQLCRLLAQDRMQHTLSPVEGTTFDADMLCSDTNIWTEPTSPFVSAIDATSVVASPSCSRNKPIGTGRPRRASMALNQAYNAAKVDSTTTAVRAPKCSLHGEECDGVSVAETWRTQHARETNGFVEMYPVISGAGERVMVDWVKLFREEQVVMQH